MSEVPRQQVSYDNPNLRPYRQTFEGKELPWDDDEQRYCGHVSQGFIKNKGGSPENTIPSGLIEILGIDVARKKGRLMQLTPSDMTEFFKAIAELDEYSKGSLPPRFWSDFSEDERKAAIKQLREDIPTEVDPMFHEAVDLLDPKHTS